MITMRYLTLLILICQSLIAQNVGSGGALDFDGTDDYIDFNQNFTTANFPFSFTVWLKLDSYNGSRTLFCTNHTSAGYSGFSANISSTDVNIGFGDGNCYASSCRRSASANISGHVGKWVHITGVFQGPSNLHIYVNGNQQVVSTSGSGNSQVHNASGNGTIGTGRPLATGRYYDGQMDELTFWDKALTQGEIRNMMCHKLSGNEPNLLAYYRFDNGSGSTLSNLVTNGPDGTLVNGPAWVLSSAPIGDRSYHNGYNGTDAGGSSLSGDSVVIHPTAIGIPGTHLYFIDSKPTNTTGINPVVGIDYYFGVFNSEFPKVYDLYVIPSGTTASHPNNTLQLATRPHNSSPSWTQTNRKNTPNYSLPGETPMSQYIIAFAGCPPIDLLPDDSASCDSLYVTLPSNMNYTWSDGSRSNVNAFINSGKVWVSAEDPVSNCVYDDTMNVNIINSSNLPSLSLDTAVCGGTSFTYDITVNGALYYRWFDGSGRSIRTFTNDGSYWFEIAFPGGCNIRDTLNVKFPTLTTDPVADDEFFICGQDTVNVYLRSNTFPEILWSNGETSWETEYWQIGTEWVTTKNADGCWQTDSFEILPTPPLSDHPVFADTSVCAGQSLLLSAPTGYTATWPNGTTGDYLVSGDKNIRVELSDGCTESVEYFSVSKYSCECDVMFGDAFTPDGDGLNDYFGPVTKCEFLEFNLYVYNRWGQEVFTSHDESMLFDGRWKSEDLPVGVYIYKFVFRTPYTKGTEHGHVTIIR